MPSRSRLRARVHAIVAALRFQKMFQRKARRPINRLRAAVHAILAIFWLRSRARDRRSSLERFMQRLSMQKSPSYQDRYLLHRFRAYGHVLVFTCKLLSKLHQRHIQCFPLDGALAIISEGQNFKLNQALNSGKCKVLMHLFSSIENRLHIVRFVFQNLNSPLEADTYKRLSACYYTLKGLCRLLFMSMQYIQDSTGLLSYRQVFAKLENINTIKFLLLEVYSSYQLVILRFEDFLSSIADTSLQEFCCISEPSRSPGLYIGHYLHLQAKKDLNQVLTNLAQHPKLYWAGFMRSRRNSLNAAEDAALRGLVLARLSYPVAELGQMEFVKEGLSVEKNYIKVVRQIGSGSYGKVDEVVCFGEKYAMKTIRGISSIKDANEAVIQAKLHHPNIVKRVWYTCNFDSQDSLSLLMELMSCNLEEFIEEQSPKPKGFDNSCPLVEVNIMMQIARAMKHLHSLNIMHRDLKAANVLVDFSWDPDAFAEGYVHVKVADFGIAKVKKAGSQAMHTWKVGTKYWRAPEVFWQEPSPNGTDNLTRLSSIDEQGPSDLASYSFSSDVYSFAMTCFEIVTGKKPFADLLKSGLQDRILKERIVKSHERPSLPEDLYPRLKNLIEECWDGRPENRPSFKTIYDQLDQIKDELLFGSSARLQMYSMKGGPSQT